MRRQKVKVNMKEFLRTGQLGPVTLGSTRRELYTILGKPEDYVPCGRASSIAKVGLWKSICWLYGDFEFMFDASEGESDKLDLIHVDRGGWWGDQKTGGKPSGGKRLDVDPWILYSGLLMRDFEKEAIAEGMNFKPSFYIGDDDIPIAKRLRSGMVELLFMQEYKRRLPRLEVISVSKSYPDFRK